LSYEEKGAREELEKVVHGLETMTDISSNEADKIIKLHNQRMQEHQGEWVVV
jgi:hypothetical protein